MSLQTNTIIYLSGTKLDSYISLRLCQQLAAHHDLELICRADVIQQVTEELIGDSKEYLGGIITLQIQAISKYGGYKELEFKGIVTVLQGIKGYDQQQGDVMLLQAKSTSILSDDGAHYASYTDMNLSEILQRTFQGYDIGRLATNFAPRFSDTIHYSVQHNQSAFSYASRLAAYHNEWFYYNGKQLIFGAPSTEETELIVGTDLHNFGVTLETIANNATYISSDYLTGALHQKSSTEITIPSEGYHGFMDTTSKRVYHTPTQTAYSTYTDPNQKYRLDTQVEHHTKANAMRQVIARGNSDNPSVTLGAVIRIQGYGRYRIISITHTNTENGVYSNEFTAVDANLDTYPHMDLNKFPKSDITIGIVIDNNDPEGLGRVKVQLPWQKAMGTATPWIRMMSPHAGTEKGFFFLPEKKQEIVLGFEESNAEKPFILGALYSGIASPSGLQTDLNDRKIIKTRSEHTLEFNDAKGAESITISDKNGNIIKVDTASSSILISAPENISITAKNIDISASESVSITAGAHTAINAGEDLNLSGNTITQDATTRIDMQATEIDANAQKIRIDSTDENLELASNKQVDVQSSDKVKLF
ncbi:type VI secretion system Vgr family protein [Aquimarina longa]|uniref:type VI secretion system Vgr family protein n=1 Tax=Aquimarina longa TaxID=1080221 RepID=UPI00078599C1|nr:phage baseplate assembly protein V [Aquimarina longa]